MVYTATRDQLQAAGLSPAYYVKKQAIFMVIGVVVMLAVAAIDYRRYRDWAAVIYGLCILMLLAVYAVGHKSRGAQAWFQIGSYQLEPSEFVKIGLIVALASYCAAAKGRLERPGACSWYWSCPPSPSPSSTSSPTSEPPWCWRPCWSRCC